MNKYGNITRLFNGLFVSHLILNVTNCLCNIASGYIAGNFLDSIAVSCNSLIGPLNAITMAISGVCSSASEILCGRYMGTGDKKSLNKVFTNVVSLTVFLGLLFTIVSFAFTGPIINLLGASSEIYPAAYVYVKAYCFGIIASMLIPVLSSYLHMENEGKYVTISVIILAASYVGFGYLLIKVFNMGYFGFGLTNSISQMITLAFLIAIIIKNKQQIAFERVEFDFHIIKEILFLGFPSGTSGLLLGFRNIYLNNVLVRTGGVTAIAAMSIMNNASSISNSIVYSVLETTIMISSVCIGERNRDDLIELLSYIGKRFLPAYILYIVLAISIAPAIVSIYTNDLACIELSTTAVRLYYLATILELVNDVSIAIFTIFEHKKFVNFINIMHCYVIHVLFVWFYSRFIGEYSVFLGFCFTEIISFIIIYFFIYSNKQNLPDSISDAVFDLDFDKVLKLNLTINSFDHIEGISEKVTDFCKESNIDYRRSNLAGLCIEEMVTNIFDHGFTKRKIIFKKVDIFVIIDEDNVSLRIRDNSVPFNPETRSIIFNPEDPCKNIGLRIVKNISKEMTYQNLFGLNNTIIKI